MSLSARALVLVVGFLAMPASASAHAFPDHSDPRVGHTVDPPSAVRIWFDGAIEPVFSTIRVEDGNGRKVDLADGRVDAQDRTLLEVGLPALSPGAYACSGAWWRPTATGPRAATRSG